MRRWVHRFRHGHWPNDRSFFWEAERATTVCRTCLIDAYRDDERVIGGPGWH